MSLKYDATKTAYYAKPDREKKALADIAFAVIDATVPCEMGALTPRNAKEFYARYITICRVYGYEPEFEPQHVQMMIGLTTDVETIGRLAFQTSVRHQMIAEMAVAEREYLSAIYE
jgi:hypothetical protein